jgi:gliding motility-associated-like protein
VNVIDLTQLEALVSDTICLGDSIQLGVIGGQGLGVLWQPNYNLTNPAITNPWASPLVDIQYHVKIEEGACVRSDSIQIIIENQAQINAIGGSYCLGDTISLLTTGNSTQYKWFPNLGLNNDTIANPLVFTQQTQQYQVVGYANCGVDTAYANVIVYSPPSLVVDSSIVAALGATITLSALSSAQMYSWWPEDSLSCVNCPNPIHVVTGNQLFWVTVVDSFGCKAIDSIWVLGNQLCTTDLIFVPNAFTPNGDGQNDIFWVRSNSVQEIETFAIYDRWGKQLFETNDIQIGWDGTYQGKLLSPDVYGYFVIFRCPSTGEKLLKKGNVTILR